MVNIQSKNQARKLVREAQARLEADRHREEHDADGAAARISVSARRL